MAMVDPNQQENAKPEPVRQAEEIVESVKVETTAKGHRWSLRAIVRPGEGLGEAAARVIEAEKVLVKAYGEGV